MTGLEQDSETLQTEKSIKANSFSANIIEPLTAKETEVLSLIASGCSNKEISQILHKSEGTIKNQVSNLLAKTRR